jgi:ribosomal-protein-serine acetyltransferase
MTKKTASDTTGHTLPLVVGEHTLLAAPHPAHASDIFRIIDGNRRYLEQYVAWTPHVTSESDTQKFLTTCLLDEERGVSKTYVIVDHGKPAGVISLQNLDRANRTAYFGYWLDPARQGRGIVTQAIGCLLDRHKAEFSRFVIKCAVSNAASNAVALRCGFVKEGVLRKAEIIGEAVHDQNIYSHLV